MHTDHAIRHYRQTVVPRPAPQSFYNQDSLKRRPVWPIMVGYGMAIATSLYAFYKIGRLLGIVG